MIGIILFFCTYFAIGLSVFLQGLKVGAKRTLAITDGTVERMKELYLAAIEIAVGPIKEAEKQQEDNKED